MLNIENICGVYVKLYDGLYFSGLKLMMLLELYMFFWIFLFFLFKLFLYKVCLFFLVLVYVVKNDVVDCCWE